MGGSGGGECWKNVDQVDCCLHFLWSRDDKETTYTSNSKYLWNVSEKMKLIADVNAYNPSIFVFKTTAIFAWTSFQNSFLVREDVFCWFSQQLGTLAGQSHCRVVGLKTRLGQDCKNPILSNILFWNLFSKSSYNNLGRPIGTSDEQIAVSRIRLSTSSSRTRERNWRSWNGARWSWSRRI